MNTFVIVTALVKHRDHFLILKRASTKKFAPNKWEFLSGFVEEKEPAEETIMKELEEETKLNGKIIKSDDPFTFIDEEAKWVVIPFLIEVESKSLSLNNFDHSEIKWITSKEFEKYEDLLPFSNVKNLLN